MWTFITDARSCLQDQLSHRVRLKFTPHLKRKLALYKVQFLTRLNFVTYTLTMRHIIDVCTDRNRITCLGFGGKMFH